MTKPKVPPFNVNTNGNAQDSSKLHLTCARCGQKWSYTPRDPEIANLLRTSTVSVAHERLIKCPNARCLQAYMLMIQGVQVLYRVAPVGDEIVEQVEGKRIHTPDLLVQ